jgi:hypothetical protein
VPAAAGVLSALGLAASNERRDQVVSYVRPLAEVDVPEGARDGEADLRYRGQSFELTATPTARGRWSSSPCGRRTCAPGRRSSSPPRSRST